MLVRADPFAIALRTAAGAAVYFRSIFIDFVRLSFRVTFLRKFVVELLVRFQMQVDALLKVDGGPCIVEGWLIVCKVLVLHDLKIL